MTCAHALALHYNDFFRGEPAVRFLTRTFRNVLYVRVGKRYVRLWRSQRSRTVVRGGSLWDGSWKTPSGAGATPTAAAGAGAADTLPGHILNPNLNQRPLRALFCLKLDNSCCYARYSCRNNCNVVVKLVQEYRCFSIHFTSVLRKQFAVNDMFFREANNYKRALALRHSRLGCHCSWQRCVNSAHLTVRFLHRETPDFHFFSIIAETQSWP